MSGRNGWDTIADLRDAPACLRAIADNEAEHYADLGHNGTRLVGPSDFRRWANATQEFLDGADTARWKAPLYLAAAAVAGFLAGAITMMLPVS